MSKGYWKSVHRQAWAETRDRARNNPELAMGSVVVAVVGALALWFGVGGGEATEGLLAKGAGTAAILLGLLWLYWVKIIQIPARWNAEKLKQIELQGAEIAKLTTPMDRVLRFRWNPLLSPISASGLLVHVTNESSQTIDEVEVEIFYIRDLRHTSGMPLLLGLTSEEGGRSVSLHPRRTKAFRLARVEHPSGLRDHEFRIVTVAPGAAEQQRHRADYAFSVRVSGRNVAQPDEAIYQLKFDLSGYSFGPEQVQAQASDATREAS